MKKLVIIGGIGAGSVIANAIIETERLGISEYEFKGFVNDKDKKELLQGYNVIGGFKDIPHLISENYYFINTVYKIDGQVFRVKLFESLEIPLSQLATFVHPKAYISHDVKLGAGNVILPNATVSSGVKFGINCRVMSGAFIGHDNVIADHCFFAANATVGSHNVIGQAAYFGLNSTMGGKLTVGSYSVIGMGAVVTKNINPFSIVGGNPAKHLRFVEDKED